MRLVALFTLAGFVLAGAVVADDPPKQAPKLVLQSPDGKKSYDLSKLAEKGPVLVRLTCACSGCDKELPYFKKLQAAYNTKGLQTLAVFKEDPESADQYAVKNGINFFWVADPKGKLWKTFEAKSMPTNVLIEKGGKIVRVVPGCKTDGKNAQVLSDEIARLLGVPAAQVAGASAKQQ